MNAASLLHPVLAVALSPLLPPSDWAMSCLMRLKVQLERLTWSR